MRGATPCIQGFVPDLRSGQAQTHQVGVQNSPTAPMVRAFDMKSIVRIMAGAAVVGVLGVAALPALAQAPASTSVPPVAIHTA
jgi:hypothetical protein